jgi:hypothetical protein
MALPENSRALKLPSQRSFNADSSIIKFAKSVTSNETRGDFSESMLPVNNRESAMTSPVYIPNDRFERLAQALTELKPNAFTGTVTTDEIKIALGEIGDIWPLSIVMDAGLNNDWSQSR